LRSGHQKKYKLGLGLGKKNSPIKKKSQVVGKKKHYGRGQKIKIKFAATR
jgi:hypothetical protein